MLHMREKEKGFVINVSSGLGRLVISGRGIYCASKHAIEALSDAYRYEFASFGVSVVVVQPGGYPTNFMACLIMLKSPLEGHEVVQSVYENMMVDYGEYLAGLHAPNPQQVADAVANVVGSSECPARVGVGPEAGPANVINETVAEVQAEFMKGLGK